MIVRIRGAAPSCGTWSVDPPPGPLEGASEVPGRTGCLEEPSISEKWKVRGLGQVTFLPGPPVSGIFRGRLQYLLAEVGSSSERF